MALIEASDFSVRHDGASSPSLGPVTLTIAPGERVLLLGPSGSGKSTLLAALAGVLTQPGEDDGVFESGTLTVDGAHPAQRRGLAGLMHQDPESQVVMATIGRDVAFGPENLGVPPEEIRRRVPAALGAVGLGHLSLDRPTAHLSGGQKQRVGLAGLLAMQPQLLLLDEPTANLDPLGAAEVIDAVDRVCREQGTGLIVVEHRLADWARVTDRAVVLAPGGGLLADGPVAEILAPDSPLRPLLRQAGVWLPGETPAVRVPAPGAAAGQGHRPAGDGVDAVLGHESALRDDKVLGHESVLRSEALAVTRDPKRRWSILRRQTPRRAVQADVDLAIAPGEAVAIMGPNGAGKSTLMLTMAGLLEPLAGRVAASRELAGAEGVSPHEWRAPDLIRRIGTVFQNPEHQFVTSTVREELEFGPRLAGLDDSAVAARTQELLERLGLEDRAEQQPFTLSGGQKRRLSVASALAAAPGVLFIDEPTFGQDAVTWGELASLVNELLADGVAVVAVTHDEDFVEAIGARIVRLEPREDVEDAS